MKKKIFLVVIFSFFLFSNKTKAQDKFHFEINGGKISNFPGQNELSNWPDGWTAGIGLKYALLPVLEIGFNTSYNNLNFDKTNVAFVTPAVCCYRYEVTGNDSKVYETAVSIQLNSMPNFFIRPYLTFRTGIYFIKEGEIYINSYRLNKIANTKASQGTYENSGRNFTKFFAGAGVGLVVYFTKNIEMRTQVLLTGALDGGQSFFPITSGLNFGF